MVAYDASAVDLPANYRHSAIYLVPAGGGDSRRITDGVKQDEGPAWSPDGKTIAYVSDREGGGKQVWLYDAATNASRKLTNLPGGAGFPSVIRAGRAMTPTHGDASWIGVDIQQMLGERLDRKMTVLNDADAAGVAEIAYGAAKGQHGVVLLLDLGTGIGSALFTNGQLVPNMQLGHVELHGRDAELRLSPAARKRRRIGWKPWAAEFNELLARYEAYVWPDLIIIGGGLAKDFPKFQQLLKTKAPLVAAAMGGTAGIVGAARVGGNHNRT
jgi:polyphosphate glucokinase